MGGAKIVRLELEDERDRGAMDWRPSDVEADVFQAPEATPMTE